MSSPSLTNLKKDQHDKTYSSRISILMCIFMCILKNNIMVYHSHNVIIVKHQYFRLIKNPQTLLRNLK